jgi:nucleoid-associated protein YgaU
MTIFLDSRYARANVDFISLTNSGDAAPVIFYEFSSLGRLTYSEYTVKEGDRLDNLAMQFYRDPERWWVIAEYNPQVSDPQRIPAGTVLRIPRV